MEEHVQTKIWLTGGFDLHVRPAARLSRLMQAYDASVELAEDQDGPWVCATRQAALVKLKLRSDHPVYIRASGRDKDAAMSAIVDCLSGAECQ
ncbi:HPr family phosphocarrier protein [Enterovibrio sp. ZSDZ35]|uniref:HPr family phosphocarrier protein n=1 Tax=Enterovibrio qingdaonensis TaxID=2899818 RepID=A0ABT5QKB7_9GAMM|nr:HPr family phosphocarrier protein [Enterovibrio sp. ZSDZ35]MDD1781432.1 HPr family phosphocarrier protein [Enterovibrio sp. ZSDZ35]